MQSGWDVANADAELDAEVEVEHGGGGGVVKEYVVAEQLEVRDEKAASRSGS